MVNTVLGLSYFTILAVNDSAAINVASMEVLLQRTLLLLL